MNRETLKKMIECAKREVEQRKKVYPRLVAIGKMKQEKADYEIKTMALIQLSLQKIYDGNAPEQVQATLFDTKEYEPKKTMYDYYNY